MSTQLSKKSVARNYAFLAVMLGAMILGSIVGWIFPQELDAEGNVISAGATVLEPLGTLFLNMMFCIVVPMVFSSIAGSVATMKSRKRAGKIMGTTVATFVITGAIAAVIMFALMKIFPPVLVPWNDIPSEEMGEYASVSDMISIVGKHIDSKSNTFHFGSFAGNACYCYRTICLHTSRTIGVDSK